MGCFGDFGLSYGEGSKLTFSLNNLGCCFRHGTDESHIKLYNNRVHNVDLIKKINEENEKVKVIMKEKINSLKKEVTLKNPKVIIGTGKSCNSDCYLYNPALMKTCPKCEGKVEEEYENDYKLENVWNKDKQAYNEIKRYNEKKICTGFRWNNNISQEDVSLKGIFDYFDKKDPEKKTHWSIVVEDPTTKKKTTEEYDVENHYMMINGERFDFPLGLTMKEFFKFNNLYFFPKHHQQLIKEGLSFYYLPIDIEYKYNFAFWYEGIEEEIGQSFGYYGTERIHMVFIYICNSCGYKYHIIKTSPFAFRDKSKDPK